MAHVHLPADHSEADLALAGAVAEILASGELYVTWSRSAGAGRPVVPAAVGPVPPPPAPRRGGLASLLARLRRRLRRPG